MAGIVSGGGLPCLLGLSRRRRGTGGQLSLSSRVAASVSSGHTRGKSAALQRRATRAPLSTPLQGGVCFLLPPLPASPSPLLTRGRLRGLRPCAAPESESGSVRAVKSHDSHSRQPDQPKPKYHPLRAYMDVLRFMTIEAVEEQAIGTWNIGNRGHAIRLKLLQENARCVPQYI